MEIDEIASKVLPHCFMRRNETRNVTRKCNSESLHVDRVQ